MSDPRGTVAYMPPEQKPSPGRIVLYHFAETWKPDGNHALLTRPAIVTNVEGDDVNLFVFFEHDDYEDTNHGGGRATSHTPPHNRYAVSWSATPKANTWSWPPRV